MKHGVWVVAALLAGVMSAGADPKPAPPHGATTIAIDYTWQSFSREERHYKLVWTGSGYTAAKQAVEPKLVDALYAALTELTPASEPLQCMSHTDDYPEFTITITGDEPLQITSQSNCHAYVPWNVTRGGKQLVQFNGAIWQALAPLLHAIDTRWQGSSPVASTWGGGEMVFLGEAKAGGSGSGEAAACARDLETSAPVRATFGEAIHVEELQLGCDLGASKDCSARIAQATFALRGVTAELELPCTGGQIGVTANMTAAIAELQTFLASKPVRALVKATTSGRPRLWNNGAWNLESGGGGAPRLAWSPKTQVIAARSNGDDAPSSVFWKELGIDPRPLVTKHDGFAELAVKLDFAGKLVK